MKSLSAGSIELADLNGDGYLDFVVAGEFDPALGSRVTRKRGSFVGTAEGTPSTDGVIELEGYQSIRVRHC